MFSPAVGIYQLAGLPIHGPDPGMPDLSKCSRIEKSNSNYKDVQQLKGANVSKKNGRTRYVSNSMQRRPKSTPQQRQ